VRKVTTQPSVRRGRGNGLVLEFLIENKVPTTATKCGLSLVALLAEQHYAVPIDPDAERIHTPAAFALQIGVYMEHISALLEIVNNEVEQSRSILQTLNNDVAVLHDTVGAALISQIRELRSSRMAIVSEVRDSLAAMKEIRAFFLESTYEVEVARLERLVNLCKEVKALKDSGVFDAVLDSALRLALGESK
jgi:hypothetical protein